MMSSEIKAAYHHHHHSLAWLGILALLASTFAVYWTTRPFTDTLSQITIHMRPLSAAQRLNVEMASRRIDGIVLRPHEKFSFNAVVGPRTSSRGYLAAPSYVGKDTTRTMGGGICLLSSALYQGALESGLNVTARTAHLRTVRTVPPGLDATVWYGQTDLCFDNPLPIPISINAVAEPYEVTVTFKGKNENGAAEAKGQNSRYTLSRVEHQVGPNKLQVETFKRDGTISTLVSTDSYELSR